MPVSRATDVQARLSTMTNRGISAAEVNKVFLEAVPDGFHDSEVKGFEQALKFFKEKGQFTPDGELALKRIVGQKHKGGGTYHRKFDLLSGISTVEKSPSLMQKWGVSSKHDAKFPTFEKSLKKAPQALQNKAMAITIKRAKQVLHKDFVPLKAESVLAVFGLDGSHIGYRIDISRTDELRVNDWKGLSVFLKKDGTTVGFSNRWIAPDLD